MTKVLRYSAALLFVTALSLLVGGSAAAQSTNNPRYRQFRDTAAASITTPAAGNVRLFFDSTGFYWKNSAGVSTALGGSGITGLTAAVIPAVATGGSSLEDSKMTTSGGDKGTWTLRDTGATGVTNLTLRSGANQTGDELLTLQAPDGTRFFAVNYDNYEMYLGTGAAGTAILFRPGSMNVPVGFDFLGSFYGQFQIFNAELLWPNSTPTVGLNYSAAGILAVTDGSTGQGGIGIADSATNTVSDALILRHATSGTAAASFGTGLVWEGENASGVMHPMASIDAQWLTATDTNEHSSLVFKNYHSGAESTMLTMLSQYGETYMMAPGPMRLRGSDVQLDSTGGVGMYFALTYDVKWVLASPGHWAPSTTDTYDIGTSSALVKNIYAAGLAVSDAATNTVTDAIALRHATSGTAAASFGTGLLFQGEDASGNMQDMARISAVYTDATNGSEDANLVASVISGGAVSTLFTFTSRGTVTVPAIVGPTDIAIESGGHLHFVPASNLFLYAGSTARWQVDTSALSPYATNTYNIGTSSLLVKDSYLSTSIQGTRTQAISDNAAAATFVTIAVPTSDTTVGGRIFYTITAIDAGTAIQTKTGTYSFGLNNIGGTVTGAGTDVLEHSQLSSGTLAPTFSVNISGTNAQFQLVLDTSLDAAAETLKIEYRVQIDSGTATVTPAT